jgi:hypothetical protein
VISTSASAATLRSTASSPSLRAREGASLIGRQDVMSPTAGGGNVRVVVRVRKFLPRGTCAGTGKGAPGTECSNQ